MTTTVEALGSPANVHHRRGLALVVAAIIAVGGAVGATVAIAADSDSSNPAPTHVTSNDSFAEQPLLRTSGAR